MGNPLSFYVMIKSITENEFAYFSGLTKVDNPPLNVNQTPATKYVKNKFLMYFPENLLLAIHKPTVHQYFDKLGVPSLSKCKALLNDMFPGPSFKITYNTSGVLTQDEKNMYKTILTVMYNGTKSFLVAVMHGDPYESKAETEGDAANKMLHYLCDVPLCTPLLKGYKTALNLRFPPGRYIVTYDTRENKGEFISYIKVVGPENVVTGELLGTPKSTKQQAEEDVAMQIMAMLGMESGRCHTHSGMDSIADIMKSFQELLPKGMTPQSKGIDEFTDIEKKIKQKSIKKTFGSVVFATNNNHRKTKSDNDVVMKYNKVDKHLANQVLNMKQKRVNFGATSPGSLKSKLRRKMENIKGKRAAYENRLNEDVEHIDFEGAEPQGKDGWISTFIGYVNPFAKANESIAGAGDSAKHFMDELSGCLSGLSKEAKKVMKGITEGITTTLSNWSTILPVVVRCALLLAAGLLLYNKWYKTAIALLGIVLIAETDAQIVNTIKEWVSYYSHKKDFATSIEVAKKDLDKAETAFYSSLTPASKTVVNILSGDPIDQLSDNASPQVNLDDVKSKTSHYVVTLLGGALLGKEAMSMNLKGIAGAISHWPSFYKGVNEIVPWAIDTMIGAINKIRDILGFDAISCLESEYKQYDDWVTACETYLKKVHAQENKVVSEDVKTCMRLTYEGIHYMNKLREIPKADRAKMVISSMVSKMNTIVDQHKHLLDVGVGARPMPVGLLISGLPGVGKSALIYRFVAAILAQILSPDELLRFKKHPEAFVYNREFETKFWDAYHQQPVCVWDDIGQSKDMDLPDNEWMDFIRCSNIFSHVCHMATLHQKGNTIFNSPILIATANAPIPKTELVTCKAALYRRFAFKVRVTVKPEFRMAGKGKEYMIDPAKMKDRAPQFMGAWQFERYDIDEHGNNVELNETYDFFEFVDAVVAKYQSNVAFHDRFKEGTMSLIDECIARRKDCPIVQAKGEVDELAEFDEGNCSWYEAKSSNSFYDSSEMSLRVLKRLARRIQDGTNKWSKLSIKNSADRLGMFRNVLYNLIGEDEELSAVNVHTARIDLLCIMGSKPCPFTIWEMAMRYLAEESVPIDKLPMSAEFCFTPSFSVQGKTGELCKDLIAWCDKHKELVAQYGLPTITEIWRNNKEICTRVDQGDTKAIAIFDFLADQYKTSKLPPVDEAKVDLCRSYGAIFLKWKDWVAVKLATAWTFFKKYWKVIAVVMGAIGALVGVLIYVLGGASEEVYGPQGSDFSRRDNYERRSQYQRGHHNNYQKLRAGAKVQGKPGLENDQRNLILRKAGPQGLEAFNVMNSIWLNNVFILSRERDSEKLMFCVGIKDRFFVTNRHILGIIKKLGMTDIWIRKVTGGMNKMFSVNDIVKSPDIGKEDKFTTDTVIFCITSSTTNQVPDITGKFMSKHAAHVRDKYPAWLNTIRGGERVVNRIQHVWYNGEPYHYAHGGYEYIIPHLWGYSHVFTEEGDCGSPLVVDIKGSHVIAGIHVIGSDKCGAANPLFREDILDRLKAFSSPHLRGTTLEGIEIIPAGLKQQCLDIDAVQTVVDMVPRYNVTHKTKLRKTPVYGKFGDSNKAPAILEPVLKDGNVVDPMVRNFMSKETSLPKLDRLMMCELATEIIGTSPIDGNDPWYSGDYKRTLTYEEAVAGIKGMSEWKGIDRSTSPGHPYLYDNKKGGKRHWLGTEGDYDFKSPGAIQLRKDVDALISDLRQGKRPYTFFATFAKDELRKFDKLDKVNTRDINADNLAKIIVVRMFFGAFMIHTVKTKINNGTAIGVNPYSAEWELMFRQLARFGDPEPVDGDVAKWDKDLHPSGEIGFFEGVCNWYGPKHPDNICRMALAEDFINPFVIINPGKLPGWAFAKIMNKGSITNESNSLVDLDISKITCEELVALLLDSYPGAIVVSQECGFCSGHVLTALLNSWLGRILNCLGFGTIMQLPQHDWVTEWRKHVEYMGLGDDNIWTKSKDVSDRFHAMSYAKFLTTIGLGYTTADKKEWTTRGNTWDKVEFLKRGFRDIDGKIEAPLNWDSIRESCYWTRVDDDNTVARLVFHNALGELALHGEAFYNEKAPAMIAAYTNAYGVNPPRITWKMNYRFIKGETLQIGLS